MTAATAVGQRVADAMVTQPRTHGPDSGLEEIRAFFDDDHLHMALIVAPEGLLITTIERPDLATARSGSPPVATLGTLSGRTAGPAEPLRPVTARLLRDRRRRLAVIDDSGRLLGLLCLKRDGTGYCSDEGIRARSQLSARRWESALSVSLGRGRRRHASHRAPPASHSESWAGSRAWSTVPMRSERTASGSVASWRRAAKAATVLSAS